MRRGEFLLSDGTRRAILKCSLIWRRETRRWMMAAPSNTSAASRITGNAALSPAERLQLARELF